MRKAIAIDFDGCLCTDAYPAIGEPNWPVIGRAKQEQRAGAGLILWTCREGQLLQEAVAACELWDLTFDAVNESLPDWIEEFGTHPRKVGASEYWDDKAVNPITLNGTYVSVEWFNQVDAELRAYKEAEAAGRLLTLQDTKYTDSDGEKALRKAMWTCGNTNNPVTRYAADAIAEKLCREAMDENLPLTLEELQEMTGEPVFIDYIRGNRSGNWRVIRRVTDRQVDFTDNTSLYIPNSSPAVPCYGRTWLAYRRKPEEVKR